jgi:DNA polymerase-3 subunit delta'
MRFADVLDHDAPKADLRAAIRGGRISPAYLFVGPRGVGRRSLMSAFAATLLCARREEEACGECHGCRMLAAGSHPDYNELESEKEQIGVDEMRAFCHTVGIRPTESRRRVSVVPDAARMTVQAANCFLKTLEEPPGETVLLLRCESTDLLLRTIVSRCQILRLSRLPAAALAAEIERRGLRTGAAAQALAAIAEGSLGRAQELVAGEAGEDWAWLEQVFEKIRPGAALALADGLAERAAAEGGAAAQMRPRVVQLLDLMALQLRRRLREAPVPRRELARLEAVWTAAERLQQNVTPDLVLRSLALDLAHA